MPTGIPVATVAINGAENAAILAVQILSLAYEELKTKLKAFKRDMAKQVEERDRLIKEEVSKL